MIVASLMKCPDGTILQSKYRYDYVKHLDKNGNEYVLDGGISYQHFQNPDGKAELITIYNTDDISLIREWMHWGTSYDEKGLPLKERMFIKVKDLSDSHLDNIIQYWKDRQNREYIEDRKEILDVFQREKEYRNIYHSN